MAKREFIPRIARWWLRIQDYDIDIEHRSEEHLAHGDGLSRMPNKESCDIEPATLLSMQLLDVELQELIKKIHNND